MKKLVFAALFLASSATFAATACDGTKTPPAGTEITGASTNFVRNSFTPRCSANVNVDYLQNQTAFAAAGGSLKGKNVFGGHSGGGGVLSVGICDATKGCDLGTVSGKTSDLLTKAASS